MTTILYFNRGNPFYLKYSLAQTVEICPGSRVVLLGDDTNRDLGLCEWHPIKQFSSSSALFDTVYKHLSENDREFDLVCFQTWFVFDEFARKEGIAGPVACLDHDVLLFENLSELFAKQDFDMATTRLIGNQYTLFRSPKLLHGFVDFVQNHYTDPRKLRILEDIFRTKHSPVPLPGGWICDMTLLGLYANTLGDRLLDLGEEREGKVFDYAFHIDEGFDWNPHKRIKRVRMDSRRRMPYSFRKERKVYFSGLHFQVSTKVFLPHYYVGSKRFPDMTYHALIKARGKITDAVKAAFQRLGVHELGASRTQR